MAEVIKPFFRLTIDNVPLEAWVYDMISKVQFKETDGNGAKEELTISMYDPELQIMESSLFVERTTAINLEIGYLNNNYYGMIFSGVCQSVENDYPSSGQIGLTVKAYGCSYDMSNETRYKVWKGGSYSDIVRGICQQYGLKAIVDTTAKAARRKRKTVRQNGKNDLKMLQWLAKKCKYQLVIDSSLGMCWFVSKKQKIERPNSPEDVPQLDYKEGNELLRSFKPKINDYDKVQYYIANNIDIVGGDIVVASNGKSSTKSSKKKKKKKSSKRMMRSVGLNGSITSLSEATPGSSYITQSGDVLWNIALTVYGDGNKYKDIYNANLEVIDNPNYLIEGTVIDIPILDEVA